METLNQQCGSSDCQNPRSYYCGDHLETLCHECWDALHFQCNFKIISKPDEVTKAIELLAQLVKGLCKEAKRFGLLAKIKGLQESLDIIAKVVQKLEEKANTAVKNDEFLKYEEIKLEARNIKSDILNSKYGKCENGPNNIFELLFYSKMLRLTKSKKKKNNVKSVEESSSGDRKSNEAQVETDRPRTDTSGNDLAELDGKDKEESCSDSEETDDEEESKTSRNQTKKQQTIKELNEKIKLLEEKSFKDETIKENQLKDLEEMKINLELVSAKNVLLKDKITELQQVIMKNAKPLRKIRQINCEKLYNDTFEREKKFDSSTDLELDFKSREARNFVEKCFYQDIELPEINRMDIYNVIHNSLRMLDDFLAGSIVDTLSRLYLNNRDAKLKCSKIIDGLSKALPMVTKEVCFSGFRFLSYDFKSVIYSCGQAQKLNFWDCEIGICKEIEFKIEHSNIKYLSFAKSKIYSNNSSETSDILIDLISKSPIKPLLKTMNVYKSNQDKKEIERALIAHGMYDVIIIDNIGDFS